MLSYLVNRLLLTIPTLLGVAVLIFFMLRVVPGDIVEVKMRGDGGNPTQEMVETERKRLGLDRPMHRQFADWMIGLATFDLGKSMWTEQPATEEIALRLELSLQVALMATVIAILLSIPLGTLSALLQGTWIDYAIRIFTIAGLAMPSFWLGMLTIVSLLYFFNWLPPLTYVPIYQDPWSNLAQLFWPALAVGYRYSAVVARMMRSSIIEVLNEDYIRTARAKGVYERLVVMRHAMRNAMLPVITVTGLQTGALLVGAVLTEKVFAYPGLGEALAIGFTKKDYPVMQVVIIAAAAVFVIINTIVDLAYALVDPRIRTR
jgi:peptide/nickel transport system permease protein